MSKIFALFACIFCGAFAHAESGVPPRPDHVVIVILENFAYGHVIGNAKAPYINSLVPKAALMTKSFAVTHPSMPNYIALFSGSTQGVSSNKCSAHFDKPNLGSELLAANFTFTGFAENLPSVGYSKCRGPGHYSATHNPWVHFTNLPPEVNQPFANFPTDFTLLPDVSIVVPAGDNSHHLPTADAWVQANLDPYVNWALQHNSLFILTCDEDNKKSGNHIPTLIIGQNVKPGEYEERINHFTVLRTLEDMFGLPPLGRSAQQAAILDIWTE